SCKGAFRARLQCAGASFRVPPCTSLGPFFRPSANHGQGGGINRSKSTCVEASRRKGGTARPSARPATSFEDPHPGAPRRKEKVEQVNPKLKERDFGPVQVGGEETAVLATATATTATTRWCTGETVEGFLPRPS
ncbi:unnamed protein product, partial [Phaeothamnion confervicola]